MAGRPGFNDMLRKAVARSEFRQMAWASAAIACLAWLGVALPANAQTKPRWPHDAIVCQLEFRFETGDCLQRLKGIASRTGDTLRLTLSNGKTKTFTGNSRACDADETAGCVVHLLLGYYPSLQSFLISTSYYECGYNQLVSRRTGSVLEISTIPEFSPHGKFLVSTDDNDACERKYDIAIWSARTDPPSLEMKYTAAGYEAWAVIGWESDERIRLKGFISTAAGTYDQEAEAVRSADGWKLIRGQKSNWVERDPPPRPQAQPPSAVSPWPKIDPPPWPKDLPAVGGPR